MKAAAFEGDTLEVIRQLPDEIRQRTGYEINRVQRDIEIAKNRLKAVIRRYR